jgi:hypothetical protein
VTWSAAPAGHYEPQSPKSATVNPSAGFPYPRPVSTTPCRFCGATDQKITNEHVWPEWREDFVPTSTGLGHTERWSSASGRESWQQPMLTATVRMFCKPCNMGWMSDIEAAAKPIVGPMVQGIATTLDPIAQQTVANWAVLKGLVAAQTSKDEQPIPDRHYRRVYAANGAPANTALVWIALRQNLANPDHPGRVRLFNSHFMPVTNADRPGEIPADLTRYISEGGVLNATIFQVGHFFALVLQHDWPGLRARTRPGTDAESSFLAIWPTGGEVRWPPPVPVDVLGDIHQVTQFFEMRPPMVAPVGP